MRAVSLFLLVLLAAPEAFAGAYICADQEERQSPVVELPSDQSHLFFDQPDLSVSCLREDLAEPDFIQTVAAVRTKKRSSAYRGYRRGDLCWSWYCSECPGGRTRVYALLWQNCR